MVRQRRSQSFEVSDVARQDRLRKSNGNGDEMSIDNVGRPRPSKNGAHRNTIVERVDDHRLQESSETRLPNPAANLCDDWMRRAKRCAMTQRSRQELLRSTFAAFDRYEEPGVKNQARTARSSPRPLRR